MAYTIYPQIQYRYDCNTIVVYNDIYNDMATEEDSVATLSSITFNIQQYGDVSYPSTTIVAGDVNGTWGSISTSDFSAYRYYPTASNPTNSTAYTLTVTYDNLSVESLTYTTTTGDTWATVLQNLAGDITQGSASYDSATNSLYITSGTAGIDNVAIASDNSDTTLEDIAMSDLTAYPQGVYKITVNYTLSDASSGSNIYYLPIYCSSKKCVLTELSKVQDILDCDSCDNSCVDYIMNAVADMETLRAEINNTEDIARAENTIARLEDFCDNKNCNCT